MNIAERIATEVRNLSDEKAQEVLDFVLFLESRETPLQIAKEPDWKVIQIDTRGWHFDRDEANAR